MGSEDLFLLEAGEQPLREAEIDVECLAQGGAVDEGRMQHPLGGQGDETLRLCLRILDG